MKIRLLIRELLFLHISSGRIHSFIYTHMKSMTTKGLTGILLFLFTISFVSCSDDDDSKPITLRDSENTTITMFYPAGTTGYTFALQGGDGNYSVQSGSEDIVTAEMIGSIDLRLKAINVGETTVTVTDNSQNTLILNISIDYETHQFKIKSHDVTIIGDDLTDNEKKAIQEKVLADIPVKVGGGYKFILTDLETGNGKAIIYTETFGNKGIETTFEYKRIPIESEISTRAYEILFNNEKRLLVVDRYYPSIRSDQVISIALVEDVTEKIIGEFPKVEKVGAFQVIDTNVY